MVKKIIAIALTFILMQSLTVFAQPSITAKSAVLMDSTTGKVLFTKEENLKLPPASITKVMTMLLAAEAIERGELSLDEMVTTSKLAASMGGTQIWLEVGEMMSVRDLLKAIAVASANDASMALGEHISNDFIGLMNTRAKELSMNNTNFLNPTGLDAKDHYSTALDIAIMSRELLKHKFIEEFTTIWMDNLRKGTTELVNTNKLIRFYKGATGLKTGTTNDAGSCLSATATRGDLNLVAVVMGCATSKDRFNSAKELLDYGFNNYTMYKTVIAKEVLKPVKVLNGIYNEVAVDTQDDNSIIIKKGTEKEITEDVAMVSDVKAPIIKGQILGKVSLKQGGEILMTYSIKAKDDVPAMTFFNATSILFKKIVTGK